MPNSVEARTKTQTKEYKDNEELRAVGLEKARDASDEIRSVLTIGDLDFITERYNRITRGATLLKVMLQQQESDDEFWDIFRDDIANGVADVAERIVDDVTAIRARIDTMERKSGGAR